MCHVLPPVTSAIGDPQRLLLDQMSVFNAVACVEVAKADGEEVNVDNDALLAPREEEQA